MGVDLRLLPFDADFFSHTILDCERRHELWPAIEKVETRNGRDVPDNFQSFIGRSERFDGSCYGTTIRTAYGENLKCVLVSDLSTACYPQRGSGQRKESRDMGLPITTKARNKGRTVLALAEKEV